MPEDQKVYASPVSVAEIDARINALAAQRNSAQNEAALLEGKLVLANARIQELEHEVEELKPEPKLSAVKSE